MLNLILILLVVLTLGSETNEYTSPLFFQECDNFSFDFTTSGPCSTSYSQKLGVGIDEKEGDQATADVTIKDKIPRGFTLFSPQKNPLQVKTVYGKSFEIPWRNDKNFLVFEIKKVPSVKLDLPGSCCACEDECGGGCGIEFFYTTNTDMQIERWMQISLEANSVTPLQVFKNSILNISFKIFNKTLHNSTVKIVVPRVLSDVKLELDNAPKGFISQDTGRWILLSKDMKTRIEHIAFSLIITPQKTGNLVLPNIVQVTGSEKGLVYPRSEINTSRKTQRTEHTHIEYRGSIEVDVR